MAASESQILHEASSAVYKDIKETLERLQKDVQNVADLEAWVRKAPWLSVEAALAAGYFAGGIIKGGAPSGRTLKEAPASEKKEKESERHNEVQEVILSALILPLIRTMGWAIPKAFGLGAEAAPAAADVKHAAKEEHPPFSTITGGRST